MVAADRLAAMKISAGFQPLVFTTTYRLETCVTIYGRSARGAVAE